MKKRNPPKKVEQNSRIEFDAHMFENEVWLTTDQVTEHLKVSRSTLFRLRKKHRIPSFKLGGTPVFPKHLLNKVLMRRALGNVRKKGER